MDDFNNVYSQLRFREQRIYTDSEVAELPLIHKDHVRFKEWQIRKGSCARLAKYIYSKKKPLNILEVGCGNGWLSAQIAEINNTQVLGIDTNQPELEQAKRVFQSKANLVFKLSTIEDEIALGNKYDIIIFAASVQYFSSLKEIINKAFFLLAIYGEIHIIDTHFYKLSEVDAAKKRSSEYFTKMGFPEMSDHYFHHSLNELMEFNYKILYNPNSFLRKFTKQKNPFYWIRITQKNNAEQLFKYVQQV